MMLVAEVADLATIAEAFWRGSVGSSSAFLSGTLVRFIPLAIVGLGLAIAFRAGVFNIGGEGQLLMGAVAGTIVGLHVGAPGAGSVVLVVCAGVAAGAGWALIAAWLRSRFGVLEVISTLMLNFIAASVVSYLVRGPLQEPSGIYPQTASIGAGARLPILWPGTRLHVGLLVAVLAAAALWWVLRFTASGFRLRATGASPLAAAVAGRIDVHRVAFRALVASGALAGLAGSIEVAGVTHVLYENLSPGYGFAAIAVAVLARLHPGWVLASALLFAILETGALGMQRDAGVPSVVALVLEAMIILGVVAAAGAFPDRGWRGSGSSSRRAVAPQSP